MELENKPITLEDEEPKEMSIIEIPRDKHYDRAMHDTTYIKELVEHRSTWNEEVLPLVINDDPPLEKPTDPPKLISEPLPSELKYVFLRDDKTWLVVMPSYLSEQQ